ncbi:MAG TPA: hypothetical protein PK926_12075 [Spirochaetota bacterium]|nr:hypothetical protein [Spirochaetota bacterium]HPI88249.1 hypothetical protein [Spirochaetota bacterium]HPR47207.1 hypothetical protein [Spirochaetota bacterium]
MNYKIYLLLLFFYFIFTSFSSASALPLNPRFELEAGFKTVLSSQSSDTRVYYKPLLKTGCRTDYFGIFAGYTGHVNYQVFDAYGGYREIALHKTSFDLEITPVAGFYTGFEFDYTCGEASYAGTEYIAEAGYDFSKVSLYGEFSYSLWDYYLNHESINNKSYDIYAEIAYYINDVINVDFSYEHLYYYSADLLYDIRKNLFRPGFMAVFKDIVILMGGVSLGWSGDSFLVGGDAGLNIYPWKYIKISALYVFSYSKDVFPYATTGEFAVSPDNTYDAHRFIAGLSFVYR